MSKCKIASIELDDAMILGRVANPDGSNFRKGQDIVSAIGADNNRRHESRGARRAADTFAKE